MLFLNKEVSIFPSGNLMSKVFSIRLITSSFWYSLWTISSLLSVAAPSFLYKSSAVDLPLLILPVNPILIGAPFLSWQHGQKVVPLPPTFMKRYVCPHVGQISPLLPYIFILVWKLPSISLPGW